jgi:ASCH domain
VKCLTIRQPWASLIFAGGDVENRSWSTNHRGRLAIHAGASQAPEDQRRSALLMAERNGQVPDWMHRLRDLPRGCVLGTVELVDVVEGYGSVWATDATYQWVLAEPVLFAEPVQAAGHLSLWEWDPPDRLGRLAG